MFMKSIISFIFLNTLVLASADLQGAPQQPVPQQPSNRPTTTTVQDPDDAPIGVTINEVRLPITVLDKKGQPVPGLAASDFLIFEDKQPQAIASFNSEFERLPVYVGVLMDTSASTAEDEILAGGGENFIHTSAPSQDRVPRHIR